MNKIIEYLKRRGMAQRELADQVCITEQSLSRYISGVRVPKVYTAIRIARALKADVYDVFPGEDDDGIAEEAEKEI